MSAKRRRTRPPPGKEESDLKRSLIIGIVQAIVREVVDLIVNGRHWGLL